MVRLRVLIVAAGMMAASGVRAEEWAGPTRVSQVRLYPIAAPYGPAYPPPDYVATPEIISRVGEILGAIDSPQKRNELAEQWLQYSKQVIAKDLEYRRQWLDLQKQQLSQRQEVDQLRLEVAKLQMQIEELHARNAQLERENVQAQARLRGPSSGPASQAPFQP